MMIDIYYIDKETRTWSLHVSSRILYAAATSSKLLIANFYYS